MMDPIKQKMVEKALKDFQQVVIEKQRQMNYPPRQEIRDKVNAILEIENEKKQYEIKKQYIEKAMHTVLLKMQKARDGGKEELAELVATLLDPRVAEGIFLVAAPGREDWRNHLEGFISAIIDIVFKGENIV